MSEWNANVICITDDPKLSTTFSGIYKIRKGMIELDNGSKYGPYKSLDDLNKDLFSKFKLVENKTKYTQLAAYKLILDDLYREFECEYGGKLYKMEYIKKENAIVVTYHYCGFDIPCNSAYWPDSEWTEVEKKWMPKPEDTYWVVDFGTEEGVGMYYWDGGNVDNHHFKSCGVYKTKKEAVEVKEKMLKALEVQCENC